MAGHDVPVIHFHGGKPTAKELEGYRDLGLKHLLVDLPTEPRDETLRRLDGLAAELAKLVALGSGAAEGLVGAEVLGGGLGVALEARPLVDRGGDRVQQPLERIEVAGRRGGQGLLDQVVARDVDRVDPVHRVGVRTQRPPARQPGVEAGEVEEQSARAASASPRAAWPRCAEERGVVDVVLLAAGRAVRRPAAWRTSASTSADRPSLARMPADHAASYCGRKTPSDSLRERDGLLGRRPRAAEAAPRRSRARFHSAITGWLP